MVIDWKRLFFMAATTVWGVAQAAGAAQGKAVYGAEYYRSPVGFAIQLAGNVGEIRSGHFHTGLDIRALQGPGSPVYAAADGFVSRVGVSPTGYGHVLYITHPNGETSVYGHLESFEPRIARWVRSQQYAKRSFRVDLYPASGQFPVKQGERIAALGNTGSSGGPHLHFEIRDAYGRPRNLIAEGVFNVPDRIPPTVSRVLLYEIDSVAGAPRRRLRQAVAVRTLPDGTTQPEDSVLTLHGPGYLAYEVIDYKDGRSNTMGVYSLRQAVDGGRHFSFRLDRIDFATTGYVAAFVDYPENRCARRTSVLRAYVSPNNRLANYGPERRLGDGTIRVADSAGRRVETVIRDDAGNATTLRFTIVRGEPMPEAEEPQGRGVMWWSGAQFRLPGATVDIPGRALYESMVLEAAQDMVAGRPVVRIGSEDVPLQRAATISLAADSVPASLRSKLVVVSVDDRGRLSNVGGGWEAERRRVVARSKRLGCFAVAADTLAPVVTGVYASEGRIPAGETVRWRATDDLSGIVRYSLTVDGRWELLAWDPKSRTLEYVPQRAAAGAETRHRLVLTVGDAKGNVKTWKGTYIW